MKSYKKNQDNLVNFSDVFPPEIWFEIFNQLPLISVVKFLKVSKKFTAIANNYLQQELKIKQIACGADHTLLLLKNGRLFAMGSNKEKQLGSNDDNNVFSPIEITDIDPIDSISVGYNHSVMMSKKNEVWIMGANKDNQLAFQEENSPNLILQKASKLDDIKAIVAIDFTTAILTKNKILTCFGHEGLKPHIINNQLKLLPNWVTIPCNLQVVDISVGKEHALLLTADGAVYGTGRADLLGLEGDRLLEWNKKLDQSLKEDKPLEWTKVFEQSASKIKVTASGSFILATDQSLMFTGINLHEQFETVEQVIPHFKTIATQVVNFDASDNHTIYLDCSNQLYAMGDNEYGQLGTGNSAGQNPQSNSLPISIKVIRPLTPQLNDSSNDFTNIFEFFSTQPRSRINPKAPEEIMFPDWAPR